MLHAYVSEQPVFPQTLTKLYCLNFYVLKIHKHMLPSHWILNSLPLLMKIALDSTQLTLEYNNQCIQQETRNHSKAT